jgi:hypothetical protein
MARATKRQVFVVEPRDDGRWAFQRERSKRASRVFTTKSAAEREAERRGREIERAGGLAQVRVKTERGRIETEHTYGKDPRKSKG